MILSIQRKTRKLILIKKITIYFSVTKKNQRIEVTELSRQVSRECGTRGMNYHFKMQRVEMVIHTKC